MLDFLTVQLVSKSVMYIPINYFSLFLILLQVVRVS